MHDYADIQVVAPLARAWDLTLTILTRPFRAWVWVAMALLVFLTTVGQYGWISPSKHVGAIWDAASGMGDKDLILGMVLRGLFLAVAVPVVVFGLWLRSRALFCLYHSIAQGEPMILAGSKKYGKEADNYFRWSLLYVLFVLVIFSVVKFLSWLFSLPSGGEGQGMWAAGFIGGISFLIVAFAGMVLESVVAPVMYLKHRSAPEAAAIAWGVMVRPHMVQMIGVLMIRLGVYCAGMFVFGMLSTFWCCGLMPILGTVIFLPVFLMLPVFALTFVDQFRPEFQVVGLHGQGMACMRCGHDLLSTPDVMNCPACGVRVAPVAAAAEAPDAPKAETVKMTASEFRESMAAPKYDERPEAIDLDANSAVTEVKDVEVKQEKPAEGKAADRPEAIDMGEDEKKGSL